MKLNDIANTLNRVALLEEAILKRAKTISEAPENCIAAAINALEQTAKEHGIAIAIIGGAATVYHGYSRSTKDVDIVVSADDYNKLLRVISYHGFTLLKHSTWMFEMVYEHPKGDLYETPNGKEIRGVFIEVMKEGMNKVPSPNRMGVTTGLGFTNLVEYIAMKLRALRAQDIADIVSVLIAQKDKIPKVQEYIANEYPDLSDDLEFCLKMVEKESQNPRSTQRYVTDV